MFIAVEKRAAGQCGGNTGDEAGKATQVCSQARPGGCPGPGLEEKALGSHRNLDHLRRRQEGAGPGKAGPEVTAQGLGRS